LVAGPDRGISHSRSHGSPQLPQQQHPGGTPGTIPGVFLFVTAKFNFGLLIAVMGRFGFVGYVGLVGGLSVALLCPVIAKQLQNRFYYRLSNVIIKTTHNRVAGGF
jgi:hypothetical protein